MIHSATSPRCIIFKVALILFSLFSLLLTPISSHAFSNARVFESEAIRWVVEDIAICTKYKYNFDAPITWAQTGYQTCVSETITTASLPATLHFKFRVQSLAADEFLASTADAYLMDNRGRRVMTARWLPTVLVDLDGPANQKDMIYYGAFALTDPKNFFTGTYSLHLQVWNSQWVKVNGPNTPERPESLRAFTFTIAQGPQIVNPAPVDCVAPNAQFPKTLGQVEENINAIASKSGAITDLSAPGVPNLLREHRSIIQQEIIKLKQTSGEAESVYSEKQTCIEQYRAKVSTISNIANNAMSNIDAGLSKAEYLEKLQSDPCTRDSQEAKTSIGKSAAIITSISNEIAADEGKGGGLLDLKDPATLIKLEGWSTQLREAAMNLQSWTEKLNLSYKQDPTCTKYLDLSSESSSNTAASVSTYAKVGTLISKASANQGDKSKSQVTEEVLPESEGSEEDPRAKLVVTFNSSQGRYIIKVDSNLPEEALTVRAIKKGARSLRFTIKTNDEGEGGLGTRSKLSGYTLILSFDSMKLDTVRVR